MLSIALEQAWEEGMMMMMMMLRSLAVFGERKRGIHPYTHVITLTVTSVPHVDNLLVSFRLHPDAC